MRDNPLAPAPAALLAANDFGPASAEGHDIRPADDDLVQACGAVFAADNEFDGVPFTLREVEALSVQAVGTRRRVQHAPGWRVCDMWCGPDDIGGVGCWRVVFGGDGGRWYVACARRRIREDR